MLRQQWDPQEGSVTCTRWGRATGKVFASAYDDSSVKVFAMGVKQPVLNLTGLEAVGTGLAFNPTEEVLAGGDAKGTVTLWSLKQGKVARTLEGGSKTVTNIAFHPSGSFAAVAGHDLTTRVWDLREKKCIQTYSAHEKTTCISFSPGAGAYIVSGGISGLAKVWDVRAGKMLTTLKKHKGAVNDLVFHPTELIMATGGDDGVVNFWSADDYSKISNSSSFKEPVKSVSFSSDGKALLAISDNNLRVMNWNPYALLDSVAAMKWGPVKDAFVRKNKLFVTSVTPDGKAPTATLLGLSSGIKPFAEDVENIAPIAAEAAKPTKQADKPESDKPVEQEAVEAKPEQKIEAETPKTIEDVTPAQLPLAVVEAPKPEVVEEKQKDSVACIEAVPKPEPVQEKKRKERKHKETDSRKHKAESRSGSHRSTAVAAQTQSSGSRRRKESTKPVDSVVPSSQVGIVPPDRQTALGLKAEEFRRATKSCSNDQDMIDLCMNDHANMCAALNTRKTHVVAIRSMWTKEAIWKAVSQLKESKDLSVVVDVLGNLSTQQLSIVPLELLNTLLLDIQCMLQSEYEDYCVLGCSLLRMVCKIFGGTIKSTREKASEARSDAVFAERLEIVKSVWDTLGKSSLQLRENLQCGGRVGSSSREILALFRRLGL